MAPKLLSEENVPALNHCLIVCLHMNSMDPAFLLNIGTVVVVVYVCVWWVCRFALYCSWLQNRAVFRLFERIMRLRMVLFMAADVAAFRTLLTLCGYCVAQIVIVVECDRHCIGGHILQV